MCARPPHVGTTRTRGIPPSVAGRRLSIVWSPNTALFLILAAVGALADLASKHWVFHWRGLPQADHVHWLWEGYVGIQKSINTGALFGIGQGQVVLFALISLAAILGILYWLFVVGAIQDRLLTWSIGMIFGGILGNLYDRLGLWGHHGVRDWILLCYGRWTWPNFNIADCLLVCGTALVLWYSWRSGDSITPSATKEGGAD